MNLELIRKVYDPARQQSGEFVGSSALRYQKMASFVPRNSGSLVVDIGCFDGSFLANYVTDSSCTKIGCDASLPALEKARSQLSCLYLDNVEKGLSLRDNSVDVVVAGEIIEHLIDTDYFLQEISRVLVPGGSLVLSTPNVNSLARRLLSVVGANAFFEASPTFPLRNAGHVRFFSFGLLRQFLTARGFSVERMISDNIIVSASGKSLPDWCVSLFPQLGRSIIVRAIRT